MSIEKESAPDSSQSIGRETPKTSNYPVNPPSRGTTAGMLVSRHVEVRTSEFKGPIPPPEIVAGYEAICPGAASRIIAMAERSQDHKISIEQRAADYLDRDQSIDAFDRRLGMACAFLLSVSCLSGAAYSLYIGVWQGAAGFGVVGAGMLARLFLGPKDDSGEGAKSDKKAVTKPKPEERTGSGTGGNVRRGKKR